MAASQRNSKQATGTGELALASGCLDVLKVLRTHHLEKARYPSRSGRPLLSYELISEPHCCDLPELDVSDSSRSGAIRAPKPSTPNLCTSTSCQQWKGAFAIWSHIILRKLRLTLRTRSGVRSALAWRRTPPSVIPPRVRSTATMCPGRLSAPTLACLFGLAVLTGPCAASKPPAACGSSGETAQGYLSGTQNVTLSVDQRDGRKVQRTFVLFVPFGDVSETCMSPGPPSSPRPLVVNWHGCNRRASGWHRGIL